jgi:hypothetical protein
VSPAHDVRARSIQRHCRRIRRDQRPDHASGGSVEPVAHDVLDVDGVHVNAQPGLSLMTAYRLSAMKTSESLSAIISRCS